MNGEMKVLWESEETYSHTLNQTYSQHEVDLQLFLWTSSWFWIHSKVLEFDPSLPEAAIMSTILSHALQLTLSFKDESHTIVSRSQARSQSMRL